MRRRSSLNAYAIDLVVAIFEAWLVYGSFTGYREMREGGPGAPISMYGKFGWGTSPAGYAFAVDTLLAAGIAAIALNAWWRNLPITLSGERIPTTRRATTCSRRKARQRRRAHP